MSRKQLKRKKQVIDDKDLRFVAYMRKSTEDEKHQMYSIRDQQTWIAKIAEQFGYNVVGTFQEEHSAAKPDNRPEFSKMMAMIESGKANAIICYHVDRLSRNPKESGALEWDLSQGIIQKIHASDGTYLPRSGNLALALQGCMATQYSISLAERVEHSMLENNRRGRCNGCAAQGYRNGCDPDNHKKSIIEKDLTVPNGAKESRYELIRKAFKLFSEGKYSPVEIKQALDEWGYRTRRTNAPITLGGVHYMLENPFYCGYTEDPETGEWHKAEWFNIAMITEDEYNRNQRIKQEYSRNKGGCKPRVFANAKKFQLKGAIICSSCGCGIGGGYHPKKMADGSVKIYTHYACNNNNHNSRNKCHLHGGISEEKAFKQISDLFDSFTISQPLYNWAIEILQKLKDEEVYERHEIELSQNSAIADLKKKRDRLLDQYLSREELGIIMTPEDYNIRREKLDKAIEELEQSKNDTQQRNRNWYEVIGKTLRLLSDPGKKLSAGGYEGEYRSILQSIGPQAYLVEKFDRYSKHGKVLTKRIIEITPYPWLRKIKESAQKIEADYGEVFTTNLQGKNHSKSAPYNEWCT